MLLWQSRSLLRSFPIGPAVVARGRRVGANRLHIPLYHGLREYDIHWHRLWNIRQNIQGVLSFRQQAREVHARSGERGEVREADPPRIGLGWCYGPPGTHHGRQDCLPGNLLPRVCFHFNKCPLLHARLEVQTAACHSRSSDAHGPWGSKLARNRNIKPTLARGGED